MATEKEKKLLGHSLILCINEQTFKVGIFDERFRDDCVIQVTEDDGWEGNNKMVVVVAVVLLPDLMIISAKFLRMCLDNMKGKRKHIKEEFVKRLHVENKAHEYLVFF